MREPLQALLLVRFDDCRGRWGLKDTRTSKRSKWDGWMNVLQGKSVGKGRVR